MSKLSSVSEDVAHTFWYCYFARKVWRRSDIWARVVGFSGKFGDLFQWIVDHGHGEDLETFVLICWSLTERNLVVFQGWEDMLALARRTKAHYSIFLETPVAYGTRPSSHHSWQPPSNGILKVNVDAAVIQSSNLFGVGFVGRDNNGIPIFAEGWIISEALSSHTTEMMAGKERLKKAII